MNIRLLSIICLLIMTVAGVACSPASDQGGDSAAVSAAETVTTAAAYIPPIVPPESHDLTQADIERLMEELSNWGRWGPDDQLGAANLITPEKRLEAIATVTEGITVSLEHTLLTEEAADVPSPFQRRVLSVPDATVEAAFRGGVSDNYNISYHGYSHSHIDSLCHIFYKGKMYNGKDQSTVTEAGCATNSIANLQGGIVTRGVLIDIPRLKGVDYLEPGTPIYQEDLEAFEEMTGVVVRPGDAVFVRTGRWARRAALGPWNVAQSAAGLHASSMPWFKARDISFLGGDAASDVVPSQIEGVGLPIHLLTITAMGVDLFDNQDLEAVAETAARLNRWEFMLVAAPLAVEGGTGSPVNVLAIF
ncbi:MAG: cyclase family protein [Gammaproteobacteria bacterium]|nr:cyclase family protein [Gammaproteobacteria bacterium]MDP6733147.1 cyclase family protein [Gammaproteobacteria bacterium]